MQNLLGLIVINSYPGRVGGCEKTQVQSATDRMGFRLSFGTHWALPIFHNAGAVVYFFLVNSVLFSIITAFGGLIGKMLRFQN
jgi:hypothetical protein